MKEPYSSAKIKEDVLEPITISVSQGKWTKTMSRIWESSGEIPPDQFIISMIMETNPINL